MYNFQASVAVLNFVACRRRAQLCRLLEKKIT